jgi:hypothetical protein
MTKLALPAAALAAALALTACGGSSSSSKSGPAQKLTITAKDSGLTIGQAAALRPGRVDISAVNGGKQPHGLLLGRLNDGVSADSVKALIAKDPAKALTMFSLAGGIAAINPGAPWNASTKLRDGTYIAVDTGTGSDGKANFTKPRGVQTFDVKGSTVNAADAKTDASVTLRDYAIDMPSSIPATASLKISNTGKDNHELTFVKVHDAKVGQAFVKLIRSGKPVDFKSATIPVLAPTGPGTQTVVRGKLAPGEYLAYCSFASARSKGKAHATLGMVHVFHVG